MVSDASHLPALVSSAIVWIMFGNVGVYSTERELLVWSRGDGLDDELGVGIGWLGVILCKNENIKKLTGMSAP